ncbi:MAG: amino acid permease [Planctomycetes bacterium]|nr:amino acid permease [Planctomycetota bacterium]
MAVSMGAMLGSGLFVLPGVAVSKELGFAAEAIPLAYLLSALIVLPAALCKSELATALPRSGGTYLYVDRGMGPLAGTVVGLGVWFSLVFKAAFALVGLGAYFAFAFGLSPTEDVILLKALGIGICLALAILNTVGVKKSSNLQNVIVVTSLIGLALFVVFSLPHIETSRLAKATQVGGGSIVKTAALVFVSFAGVTKICSIAEEVKDPSRNLPLGILLSLAIVSVIYVVVTTVLVGVVDLDVNLVGEGGRELGKFAGSPTPLATVAHASLGKVAGFGMAIMAVLTLTSMTNSGMMTSSRFPLAMARDRLIPEFLSRLHSRFRTPVWSIMLTASIMIVLVAFVDVINLAKLASAFMLLVFGVENLAVIVLRESGARWYKPTYTVPLYPWVPIIGFLGTVGLLGFLGTIAYVGATAIVVFGVIWYFAFARSRVERRGAVTRLYGDRERVSTRMSGVHRRVNTEGVIVPIFERDEDIEDLIPIAGLLAEPGTPIRVLRIEEIPDQTALGDVEETDDLTLGIAEHVEALAKEHDLTCTFEDVVTHHAKHVLYERAVTVGTHWIVMRWQARSPWRRFIPDPVAWFIHHPPTHLALFKETPDHDGAGLTRFKKVLVFAEPGPNDTMVVHVADRFAVAYGSTLTFVHLLPANADDESLTRHRSYHHGLARMCAAEVGEPLLIQTDEDLKSLLATAKDFDLLILGAPPEREVRGAFRGGFEDRATEQAPCAVLRVKAVSGNLHAAQEQTLEPIKVVSGETSESGPQRVPREPGFRIGDLLENVEVLQESTLRTKTQLFKAFAEGFATRHPETSAEEVEAALWDRERKQVTALGQGIAVPHLAIDGLSRTYVELWVMDREIPFEGVSNDAIDVCFFVVGPSGDRRVHLRTLARIGHLALLPEFVSLVRSSRSEEELLEVISTHEDELEPR